LAKDFLQFNCGKLHPNPRNIISLKFRFACGLLRTAEQIALIHLPLTQLQVSLLRWLAAVFNQVAIKKHPKEEVLISRTRLQSQAMCGLPLTRMVATAQESQKFQLKLTPSQLYVRNQNYIIIP